MMRAKRFTMKDDHQPLKRMAALAYPDDASLVAQAILARDAASGVPNYLVRATRARRGWFGPAAAYPGPQTPQRLRKVEDDLFAGLPGPAQPQPLFYNLPQLAAA